MALFGGALGGVVGGATVKLVLDDSQFRAGLAQAKGETQAAGGAMSKFGGVAKAAFALAGTAALAFAASSLKAFMAAEQIGAQTDAVLRSTGGAANVTADGVANLAGEISNLSGIDDDAIQASENLLLTFRDVHNEAGKGNDIFDQTTQAITDMATAMNQGAIPSQEQLAQTTIQVGKAMNDPIQGMTALRRVGVSFTQSQVDLITQLQNTGDLMGAQKVILGELTTEFGGAAEAAGDTFAGSMAKATNKLDNFKEAVGGFLASELLVLTGDLSGAASMWVEVASATDEANDALYNIAITAGLDGSAIGELTAAQSAARTEMQHTTEAASAQAAALQDLTDAAQAQYTAELALAGGLLGLQSSADQAADAESALLAARQKVYDLAAVGKKGTDAYRAAIEEEDLAAREAAGSELHLASAVQQYIQDSGNSVAATREAIGMIESYGQANGLTSAETQRLTDDILGLVVSYGHLPPSVATQISAPGLDSTMSSLVSYWTKLNSIPTHKDVYIVTHYSTVGSPGTAGGPQ